MVIPAIIHMVGEDAILGDLDSIPNPTHQFLMLRNIRKKDNKPLAYVADEAQVFLFAWHRISFVEIMADIYMQDFGAPIAGTVGTANGTAQKPAGTTVLGFFRDDES